MHTATVTPALDALMRQATKRSRFWLLDAVVNMRNGNPDEISEAADDFVSENGKGSTGLANAILVELGEEPIFATR